VFTSRCKLELRKTRAIDTFASCVGTTELVQETLIRSRSTNNCAYLIGRQARQRQGIYFLNDTNPFRIIWGSFT